MNVSNLLTLSLSKVINRLVLLAVLGFLIVLLWCVYKLWVTPVPGAIRPAEDAMLPLVVDNRVPVEDIHIITERPLFWRSRKAIPIEAGEAGAVVDAQSGDLSRIKVLGVYSQGAMISGLKGRGRISVGDDVFGWKLRKVSGNQLKFTKGGRSEYLSLEEPPGSVEFTHSQGEKKQ